MRRHIVLQHIVFFFVNKLESEYLIEMIKPIQLQSALF